MVTGRAWHHLGLYILMLVAHAEPFLSFGAKSHGLGLPGAVMTYTWAGQAAGCRVGTWSSHGTEGCDHSHCLEPRDW